MTQGPRTPPRHVPTLTEVIPLSPAPVREQTPAPERCRQQFPHGVAHLCNRLTPP